MIRTQFRDDVVPAEELVRVMEDVVSTISYCNTHTCLKVSHRAIRRYAVGLRKSKTLTFGFEIEYI